MRRGWGAAERAAAGGAAAVVAVWLITTALWLTPGLTRPDGVGYFAYLPSTWLDRDLLFFDEWAQMRLIRPDAILFKDVTPTGHLGNHWTVGTALVWYPSYLAADALARVAGEAGTGFSVWHISAVTWTSALAGLLVMLAALHAGRRVFPDAGGVVTAATIAIWFGSPLLFYSTRHASMSHAISAAICTGVVMLALRLREQPTHALVFATGMAIGFACAVRPQNIVIALVPLVIGDPRPLLRRLHFFLLGGIVPALPQLIASHFIYGGPLVFVNIGGRAHSWQMFATFRPLETMFSWYHGLVMWTPLLVVAIGGLLLLRRYDRGLARAGFVAFAAQWLVLSVLERWFWGGASFGQRRFDSCTIFFILGLAAVFQRLPRLVSLLVALPAIAWTMFLFIATGRLNLNRFQTAPELIEAGLAALSEPQWRTFLGFLPPEMRASAVMTGIVVMGLAAIAFILLRGRRLTVPVAIYFLSMAAFLAWCGMHPKHDALSRSLITRAERGELPSAARRDMAGLLRDEAEYMHRTGRPAEADAALREAAALSR
jgi:hypothetical protein